jgi:mRNA interferase MazF
MANEVNTVPLRGEIYWVDFNPSRGSEQAGVRPAVVISTDSANRALPVVTIAAVTTKIKNFQSKLQVILPEGEPLKEKSAILAFQVVTIDKSRLRDRAGTLNPNQKLQLNAALRLAWNL